jgi:hypothetical protein
MKKLQKILIVTLCGLLLPKESYSQGTPVIDATAIGTAIAGFAESSENAIKNGVQLANQLDIAKDTYDQMKGLKEFYEKIDAYIYNMQEAVDIYTTATELIKETSDIYKSVVNPRIQLDASGDVVTLINQLTYDTEEVAFLLNLLTNYIKDVASITQRVSAILDPDLFKWSSAERVEGIDASKTAMTRIKEAVKNVGNRVRKQNVERAKASELITAGIASPTEAALFIMSGMLSGLPIGSDFTYLFFKAKEEAETEKSETTTEETSVNRMKGVAGQIAPLFWALSAFVALFGLFKVVRKVQAQEDVGKAISIWITAVLLFIIFGQLYSLIFS